MDIDVHRQDIFSNYMQLLIIVSPRKAEQNPKSKQFMKSTLRARPRAICGTAAVRPRVRQGSRQARHRHGAEIKGLNGAWQVSEPLEPCMLMGMHWRIWNKNCII